MRKHYSATFNADAIKALMKAEKTISQLAAELGVHPTQLKEWKKIALQGLASRTRWPFQPEQQAKAVPFYSLMPSSGKCASPCGGCTHAR